MGHERLGLLPNNTKWRSVVSAIADLPEHDFRVDELVEKTLANVQAQYRRLHTDPAVSAAFAFIVYLSSASKADDPRQELRKIGIVLPDRPSLLAVATALQHWLSQHQDSLERSELARAATADALGSWYGFARSDQKLLFTEDDPYRPWRNAASGAGFCELSRFFFAKLTERYLRFFLEREASSALRTLEERDRFSDELRKHIHRISEHAFETSRITQSFAAGWFNKNTRQGYPSPKEIEGFLAHAFGKMREGLSREVA